MARLRFNFQGGLVTDNPLSDVAVTLNSSALASFPVVSGSDIAVVTFDPQQVYGVPEIVYITAHGSGATSATILRAQEGTTARSQPQNTVWVHDPTAKDFNPDTTDTPSTSHPGDAGTPGTSALAAPSDHQHPREVTDNSTIEYAGAVLRLKDAGITAAKFATSVAPDIISATTPGSPIEGDTWYVSSGAHHGRKAYYDGANWIPFGGAMPFLNITSASTQTLPDSVTWNLITGFTVVVEDLDSLLSSGGLLVPTGMAGRWLCTVGVRFGAGPTGTAVGLQVNGADHVLASGGSAASLSGSKVFRLAAGGTVKPEGINTGGSAALAPALNMHFFQAEYLGA